MKASRDKLFGGGQEGMIEIELAKDRAKSAKQALLSLKNHDYGKAYIPILARREFLLNLS